MVAPPVGSPAKGPSIVVEWLYTVSEVGGTVEVGRDRVLDRTVVSSRVADVAQVGDEVVMVPAHEVLAPLTARQRLIVGGCHVHRVGLADVYGIDVIAGVAVRDGSSTLVFLEEQLGQQSAERMARWINQVPRLSTAQRIEAGWVHQLSLRHGLTSSQHQGSTCVTFTAASMPSAPTASTTVEVRIRSRPTSWSPT